MSNMCGDCTYYDGTAYEGVCTLAAGELIIETDAYMDACDDWKRAEKDWDVIKLTDCNAPTKPSNTTAKYVVVSKHDLQEAFERGLASGIAAVGRTLGYDGVCNENDCACLFDVFPACGDICNGRFGHACGRLDCEQNGTCVSANGVCPDDCEFFERRQDWELD